MPVKIHSVHAYYFTRENSSCNIHVEGHQIPLARSRYGKSDLRAQILMDIPTGNSLPFPTTEIKHSLHVTHQYISGGNGQAFPAIASKVFLPIATQTYPLETQGRNCYVSIPSQTITNPAPETHSPSRHSIRGSFPGSHVAKP